MDLRTGAAYWPLKSGLISVYPALEHDEKCDVAVLGAGITGALAASRLAAAGCDVVVLDGNDVAMGSTAGSTGLLQDRNRHPSWPTDFLHWRGPGCAELESRPPRRGRNRAALRKLLRFQAAAKPLSGVSPRRCHEAAARVPSFEPATGLTSRGWSEQEIARRYGFERDGAILSGGDAEVDPYQLTHRALAGATERGTRVYDRTHVDRIRPAANGIRLETNRGAAVKARRLVIAAGYEVARHLKRDRGHLHSTWAMISEPLREFSWWPDQCLIWETRRPYLYIRTTADGRVIAGGEDEPWSSAHESIGLMKKKVMRLTRKFRALFPGVEIEPAYAWAGIFGTTPDGLPYIGTLPEYPHTYFALGYGGNGITFGMIAADLVRDWWAGTPGVGQTLFGFDRLSRGA